MSTGGGSIPTGWEVAHDQDKLVECIRLVRDTLPFYYEDMTLIHCVRNINAGCMTVWRRWGSGKKLAIVFQLRRDPVGSKGVPILHYVTFGTEDGYDAAAACDAFVEAGQAFKNSSGLRLCFMRQPELDVTQSRLAALLTEAGSRPGLLGTEVSKPKVPPWPAHFEREITP